MTPEMVINAVVVVVSAVMSYLAFNRRLTQVEAILTSHVLEQVEVNAKVAKLSARLDHCQEEHAA